MKGKTIIGLVLAAGLLLIGTVAYGHWNDYGPQGNYGTGYGYGCGYGHVYGAVYNVTDPAIRNNVPCYGYRHGGGNWNSYDSRRDYGNGWTGYEYRDHRRMGPRGCW